MSFSSSIKHYSIEVITGCMFSGKTEELLRRISGANSEGFSAALFKPEIDNRYHTDYIVSHNGRKKECYVTKYSNDILSYSKKADVIGIDEAQFYDQEIIDVCLQLASRNHRIIIAGLDKDFNGHPFGPMQGLMDISKDITFLSASCNQCGNPADHTYKKTKSGLVIEIGEKNIYEARCYPCYQLGMSD